MERNTQLMRVIQEMRSEMQKLERENKALRVELDFTSQRTSGWENKLQENREEGAKKRNVPGEKSISAPIAIHRTVSADSTLALKESKGNIMTVRRYTISSSVHSFEANENCKSGKRHLSSRILDAQGIMKSPARSPVTKPATKDGEGFVANCFTSNSSDKRTFQDHVFKCRGKIKAVSFLLPMEMSSYSKDPDSLKCTQNQNPKQLSTIMEKDM
ncbi:putative coiled-coil domain-containing protein 195 [Monodelphis domestica]|uniref:putative coiled-coil domain-containing protein 195 n=1 Tax=Monodelphis domestica TaxID=13616 RepID=UPI0024E1B33A|nr:putative coiled-coil domain-containing protein 195 [Monodelphis domestica]